MRFERLAIQDRAVFVEQRAPAQFFRDGAGLAKLGILIIHFQEDQIGELLDVIAIRDAVIPQDVAVIPDTLDDGGGLSGHQAFFSMY